MTGLTDAELRFLDLTVELVACWREIIGNVRDDDEVDDVVARGDTNEFIHHVHILQHVVMAQAAARHYPDELRLLGRRLG